jgi:uncharacterized protein
MMKNQLIIFVKTPRLGWVKTRLARHIGKVAAWRFYRQTTDRLLRRMSDLAHSDICLHVAPGRGAFGPSAWPARFARRPQSSGNIGDRMINAFRQGPAAPTVLIGSDIPAIRAKHVEDAFRALKTKDIVFGPAEDGGFWLIGLRQPQRPLHIFKQVGWSSQHTLQDVLNNIPAHLKVGFVATLRDVDEIEDWQAYQSPSCSRKRGINSAKLQGL